ncbi:hypothetical protein N9I38_03900 [Gammaproteobacteria bacterium]|jgi:hypothetical protein|nr:hypothetical protein [Gammaproteobacteria bacterium]MDB9861434.1 hypothetical protein [Gammaproteobacteria bacterium]|tara:strand:+ start:2502 stop:3212 length:711 start_codon:yes stop_codon:yes gene_type:complete
MKIMMFKINLLLILIIPGLLHAQEVMDYKAEYFFETDKFSVSGIRELKTTDNQSSLTFNAKTKLLKLFFESSFDIRNNQVFSDKYSVKLKAFLIKRNYLIEYDNENKTVESSDENAWKISYKEDLNILDPLNAQIQMRINVKKMVDLQDFKPFEILLQDIRNGKIEKNIYKFSRKDQYKFKDKLYDSIVIERVRDQDSRVTEYHLVPSLGYLILEVIDRKEDGIERLTLQKILSLG